MGVWMRCRAFYQESSSTEPAQPSTDDDNVRIVRFATRLADYGPYLLPLVAILHPQKGRPNHTPLRLFVEGHAEPSARSPNAT